jgi:hypothetical protein
MKFLETVKDLYFKHWIIWTGVLAVIAIPNFGIFMLVAMNIGGDAVSGSSEGGRYYVANHGVLTEVSPRVYFYSYIHALSVMVTSSLFVLNGFVGYLARPEDD